MNTIEQIDWSSSYKQYVDLRKKGLKKQAQICLKDFIEKFQQQSKAERRRFIDVLYKMVYKTKEYSLYLPYNLSEGGFKNEIADWINDEPFNSIPYKWSGDFRLMRKSLEINPFDQETLLSFGKRLTNHISMNQHEISTGHL